MPDETSKIEENVPKKAHHGILRFLRVTPEARKHALTLFMSIVALSSLLLTVTYSWFIASQEAGAYRVRTDVYEPPQVYIGTKLDGDMIWGSNLDVSYDDKLKQICGCGDAFYTPTFGLSSLSKHLTYDFLDFIDSDEEATLSRETPSNYTKISDSQYDDYLIVQDFSLRTTFKGDISLAPTSTVAAYLDESAESLYLEGISTGYVGGAVRVAILQKTSNGLYKLKCVWIPNATYEFDAKTSTFITTGDFEEKYTFVTGTKKDSVTGIVTATGFSIETADYPDGGVMIDDVLYVWDLDKCRTPFSEINTYTDSEFRLYVWLEGTDRECVTEFAGGRINLLLGINVDGEAEEEE